MKKLNQIPRFQEWMQKIKDARYCGQCKNWYLDEIQKDNIKFTDECLNCEHVNLEKLF